MTGEVGSNALKSTESTRVEIQKQIDMKELPVQKNPNKKAKAKRVKQAD